MIKEFSYTLKIYYEDTDAGGVVYHSNYLKYLERARSEAIYTLGLSNKGLLKKYGILILVKSCNIEYLKPAIFEDVIKIISVVRSITKTSFVMEQKIYKENQMITKANIHLVVVNQKGKPCKIPKILKEGFK
tara:strand:+ start:364 stop:759 length:396 start_codon:yes stop_codon:yes gene_type:complete